MEEHKIKRDNSEILEEKNLEKKIFQILYPNGEVRTGFFIKFFVPNKLERIKVLLTTYSNLGEKDLEEGMDIKVFSNDEKDSGKIIKKEHCKIIFQDEICNATMIEIFKDADILNNIQFINFFEEYEDYSKKSVFLVDFCSDKKLIYPVGLITPKEEAKIGEDEENENKIEYFCFYKGKSSGGPILLNNKVLGLHYGNNNKEGKYWNSGIHIINIISGYYGKNGLCYISKKKKEKKLNNNNQKLNNIQNNNLSNQQMNPNNNYIPNSNHMPINNVDLSQNNINSFKVQMNYNTFNQNNNYTSNNQIPNSNFMNNPQNNMNQEQYNINYHKNNMIPSKNYINQEKENMNQRQNNKFLEQSNLNKGPNNIIPKQPNKALIQNNKNQVQKILIQPQTNMVHENNNMNHVQNNMPQNQYNMIPKQNNMVQEQNNMIPNETNMVQEQNNMIPTKQVNIFSSEKNMTQAQNNQGQHNMNRELNMNNPNYNNSMNQNQNLNNGQFNNYINMNNDISQNQNSNPYLNSISNQNSKNNAPRNFDNKMNTININSNNNYNSINNNSNNKVEYNMNITNNINNNKMNIITNINNKTNNMNSLNNNINNINFPSKNNIILQNNKIPEVNNLNSGNNVNLMNNQSANSNLLQNGQINNNVQENIINNQNRNINSLKNESIQKDNKFNSQNKNAKVIQNNEINNQNSSTDNQIEANNTENKSITNQIGNDNRNDYNQNNQSSNKININQILTSENRKQNENILSKINIINNENIDPKKTDINNNEIVQYQIKNVSKYKDKNQINEIGIKNKNENNSIIINEIKTNNEINEFKDIYPNIDVAKINIFFVFILRNNEKKGYKIPSNLTGKEIYYIAYNLCDENKGEFEYKKILKLYYNANILKNDDTIQALKNNDEIIIAQSSILSFLKFDSLKDGKKSKKLMHFIFSDSSKETTKVDLPNDIKDKEIQEHISSIYNKLFDYRIKCELYFNNKIYESKNKKIESINIFKKLENININIKVKNIVSLQNKPGKILKVQIQENKKLISEICVGTFEKIKDFLEDLQKELVKKKYRNYKPSFQSDGKIINLNENDDKTFFSINIRKNFTCAISLPPPVKKKK